MSIFERCDFFIRFELSMHESPTILYENCSRDNLRRKRLQEGRRLASRFPEMFSVESFWIVAPHSALPNSTYISLLRFFLSCPAPVVCFVSPPFHLVFHQIPTDLSLHTFTCRNYRNAFPDHRNTIGRNFKKVVIISNSSLGVKKSFTLW
jgi:hypothetical protein